MIFRRKKSKQTQVNRNQLREPEILVVILLIVSLSAAICCNSIPSNLCIDSRWSTRGFESVVSAVAGRRFDDERERDGPPAAASVAVTRKGLVPPLDIVDAVLSASETFEP